MKTRFQVALVLVLGLMLGSVAHADDDLTMDAVGLDEQPEALLNTIALPEEASEEAVENAAFGLDTANQARELGREFGERMAEDARDGNVSEQIRDEALDRAADHRPEVPGRP
jgi:hypothetical protein